MNRRLLHNLFFAAVGVILIALVYDAVTRRQASTRILIFQDKPQEWADALKLGFEAGLRDSPEGHNVTLITKSAAADPQAATTLAQIIGKEHYALVYALGTQASQEVFRVVKDKPVIFGAVTDPVAAGFYEASLNSPKGEITGTQDIWPYSAQFDLMLRLVPQLKQLGILYNSSEINSQVSVGLIEKECSKRGISLLPRTVTEPSQISLAVAGLLQSGIQAFFIPADNTAQGNAQVIIAACLRAKIPVFTGISGIVENGALGTVGTNYVELGRVNARQAIEILKGMPASKVPVASAASGDLYLNRSTAEKLGIQLPEELLKRATNVYR